MTIIAEFETDPILITIMNKHHAWHSFPNGMHGFPSRAIEQGQPGSGAEFFLFHKQLMGEFFAWNNVHHAAAPVDIAAWNAIPAELKVGATGWPGPGQFLATAETKINANPGTFTTIDAFGIHVETTIHNWIHGAVASCPAFALPPDEQNIISSLHSVQSTWFYHIHGLVQFWSDRWQSQHSKSLAKEVKDHGKEFVKEHGKEFVKEHAKEFAKEHGKELVKEAVKEHHKDFKEIEKPVKEKDKDKDLVENLGGFNPGDPIELISLKARVAELEKLVQQGQTFIRAAERPTVGDPVVKPKKPE